MRRFVMLALSLSVMLGFSAAASLRAQDAKKDEPKKEEAPAAKPAETKPAEAAKPEEPAKPAEPVVKPIPPEVEAKLAAARKAVAEAIVAAQDAGLVDSSIDPPPILDILITGRATDGASLKARTGVSPEVFGAWFTGYGKAEGVNPQTDVRIIQPSGGLKAWYDQRAAFLNREIEAVRKAKPAPAPAAAPAPTPEPKKEEPKAEEKKEEPKKEEPKAEEKKEEAKPEPKKEEAKPEEKKAEEKKDESKPEEKK